MKHTFLMQTFCIVSLAFTSAVQSQVIAPAPIQSHEERVLVDSGHIYNHDDQQKMVWSEEVSVEQAVWVRLRFSSLALGDDGLGGPSSTLRIVSLEDGADQFLNAKTAREWRNTSAYFNGNAVRLELYAYPNGKLNQVEVSSVLVGDPHLEPRSICDGVDDRVPSSDPRAARLLPLGCSGWLFNDRTNCFLTAGHCVFGNLNVCEFNVPLSDPNGNINVADPDDQYPVDPLSIQGLNAGVGADWGYFGCFNNSNTGLSPLEAQGDSYVLDLPPPVSAGDQIRVTGYGTTSSPVNPQWNQIQKTHVGEFVVSTQTELRYRPDTTGGNSGSPVIFEQTGAAIGIHTHGGCGNGSGSNAGTAISHPGLQNGLENPLGVCATRVSLEFPNGRPALISPSGGTTVRVVAVNDGQEPAPGTGLLFYNDGQGFQSVPMTVVSKNIYDAVFPEVTCEEIVSYYVQVDSTEGDSFPSPVNAPGITYTALAAESTSANFEDNFQADMGWSVSGDALDGAWERGVPAGGGDRGDPATDADQSGACYVTDNADDNSDVDDGTTILTSPTMDGTAPGNTTPRISYYRWYSNTFGNDPNNDVFIVEISNDDGATWNSLETVGPGGPEAGGGWIFKSFAISDFVTPTDQMRVRFIASDLNDGSVVEAGVDSVKIEIVDCGGKKFVLGDVNQDGTVDLLDVAPFISLLEGGLYQVEADINGDGTVDLLDIAPFVDLLSG